MSDPIIALTIVGRARTKGSLKVVTPRGRKPVMVEDHAHSKPWRQKVVRCLRGAYPYLSHPYHRPYVGAVSVGALFTFERVPGASQLLPWPTLNAGANANGDIDKLLRNALDALVDARVIADDCQVVEISSRKVWGDLARLDLEVRALDD